MFTIIMPDERLMERFDEFQPLLEPFFRRGDIALCPWKTGQDGQLELSEWQSLVPGDQNWRALILTDSARPGQVNPFDCSDAASPEEMPLPQLTRRLCGHPSEGEGELLFDTGENRPAELLLLSTRYIRAYSSRQQAVSGTPSEFWRRCCYAWQSRFLTLDVHLDKGSVPERDLFLLWTAALTLSLNEISSGALHAFRLYRLDLQIDEDEIARIMADKCAEFLSVRDAIQMRRQKHRELYPKDLPKLEIAIPVVQDTADTAALTVELRPGLFVDSPKNEANFWNAASQTAQTAAERLAKRPRRRVEDAAALVRSHGKAEDLTVTCLSPRQKDDLLEETLRHEAEMIRRCAPDSSVEMQLAAMEKSSEEVRKELRCRVRKADGRNAILIALGLFLAGLLPWCIHALLNSLSLMLLSCYILIGGGILFAVGMIGLHFLRRPLKEKIDSFNKGSAALLDTLERRSAQLSESLTDTCAALRGWQVLEQLDQRKRSEERLRRQCDRHLQALEQTYGRYAGWASMFGRRVREYMEPVGFVPFDPELLPSENPVYRLQPDSVACPVPDGDPFRAPYKFVTNLKFHREEVIDE